MNTFYDAQNDYRNYLKHYGVKGMRWKFRRGQKPGLKKPVDNDMSYAGNAFVGRRGVGSALRKAADPADRYRIGNRVPPGTNRHGGSIASRTPHKPDNTDYAGPMNQHGHANLNDPSLSRRLREGDKLRRANAARQEARRIAERERARELRSHENPHHQDPHGAIIEESRINEHREGLRRKKERQLREQINSASSSKKNKRNRR